MNAEQIRHAAARDRVRVWVLAGALSVAAACVVILQEGLSDGFVAGALLAVGVTLVGGCTIITRGITEDAEDEVGMLPVDHETPETGDGEDSSLFYELMNAAPGEVLDVFDLAVLLQHELRDRQISEADVTRWALPGYRVTPREVIRLPALVVGRHVYALEGDALDFADAVLRAEAWTRPRSGR